MFRKVGILYHPKLSAAESLARNLARGVEALEASSWVCSIWEEQKVRAQVEGTELIFSVGGDGTIIRAAHAVVPWPIPILGINLGRVGFMAELRPEEALERLGSFLKGEGWIEERLMLQAELYAGTREEGVVPSVFHALNDVVVSRGAVARVIHLRTSIDGEVLTTYKADGLIVATPTGSTGYALAAAGPILHPELKAILLQPIMAHLSLDTALVVPATATVELEVRTDHQAILSIDGQIELSLQSGDVVKVRKSPYVARFLRTRPQTYFYGSLTQKLK